MPFADDIADRFPEVDRSAEQPIELELRDADARVVRDLSRRLGMRPAAVMRLALIALARRPRIPTSNCASGRPTNEE